MKIMHIISGGDFGGAKTHVLTLLQGLSKTQTVRLVCFVEGEFSAEAREMGIDTLVMPQGHLLSAVTRLKKMVSQEQFQVVHCHGSRANLIGALLQDQVKVPVVTTVHSDYRLDYLGRPLHRLTYGTINTVCVRRIRNHIGVSDSMADLLIQRGFDPLTMFSIYNGVDYSPRVPAMDRQSYLNSIGLQAKPDDVVFGIAARLSAVKDVATLIRAFGLACHSAANIRLVIAGEGEQRQELEQLAAECCPEGSYVFAGWVQDMDSFYHALDVNTLTSLSETFPYALTEGARMRCATIASRVGGVPTLVDHGINGLLFTAQKPEELAEHMVRLAGDCQLREQFGEALYQKAAEKFSIDATVRRQEEIYQILLRRAARKPGHRDGVLICGAYGKGNAGDDSILDAILAQLRHIDPDLPVYVLSRKPEETRLRYRVGAIHTFDPRFLLRMRKTALYINGGGSLIQDVTSSRSLQYYLSNIALAKACGNPVLMYGCGIGPVNGEKNRKLAGRIMDHCADWITLRDPQSAGELAAMGVTQPKIEVTADPALLLDSAPDTAVDSFLLSQGMDPRGNYALFVLRPWKGLERVCGCFIHTAEKISRELGLTPVFLALEPGRDLPLSQLMAKAVHRECYVISAPQDGTLIAGLMRRMSVVISMRLHALIFAAGQGIPLVGIVYDPKVSGFLDYLQQRRYVDLDHIDIQCLFELIQDALSEGSNGNCADHLRTLAQKNEDAARSLLEQGGLE